MKKINLAITGCMGRMGQQIIKSARSDKNFKIVALTENRIVNKKIHKIKPSLNTLKACSVFKLGLIPLIFLLIIVFSVRATILKFLSDLADLIIC